MSYRTGKNYKKSRSCVRRQAFYPLNYERKRISHWLATSYSKAFLPFYLGWPVFPKGDLLSKKKLTRWGKTIQDFRCRNKTLDDPWTSNDKHRQGKRTCQAIPLFLNMEKVKSAFRGWGQAFDHFVWFKKNVYLISDKRSSLKRIAYHADRFFPPATIWHSFYSDFCCELEGLCQISTFQMLTNLPFSANSFAARQA